MKRGALIRITGIVQGVGFRPFVYRNAVKQQLDGFVTNVGDASVQVWIEGEEAQITSFIELLKKTAPPMSEIDSIKVEWRAYEGRFHGFSILDSKEKYEIPGSMIPPDISICDECVSDILTLGSRWYHYPFTCCAHCGPRFTAVQQLPYDRARTNMRSYPLCSACMTQYEDPLDRRFHAQGICCPMCGPQVTLYDCKGSIVDSKDPFVEAGKLLDEGSILAVKGVGGIHVAVKTTDDDPLIELRSRKGRPTQPLALMSPNVSTVKTFASVSSIEGKMLLSWRRPIVLLTKSPDYYLSEQISIGLNTVGVMLPYTGIHLLLFQHTKEPALVMTSGNRFGMPMAITNEQASRTLKELVDYLLLHDRNIESRCDDSVVREVGGTPTLIRRSRGYVPTPVDLPYTMKKDTTILGLGAELRNTGTILYKRKCYITQHIGDTDNLETLDYLRQALHHMRGILKITGEADMIACDMHPRYLTSRLASEISQESDAPLVRVQHHHAHTSALMAENEISPEDSVVGIVMDGMGFGPDGTVWGGEILEASYDGYERCGHLMPQPMPGGDLCTVYPLRMLVGVLHQVYSESEVRDITLHHVTKGLPGGELELEVVFNELKSNRLPLTSSAGRILDAVSTLMGLCYVRKYEGEPALRLEALSEESRNENLRLGARIRRESGKYVLDTSNLVKDVVEASKYYRIADVCAAFQRALSTGMAEMAVQIAKERGLKTVGFSGGVAVNRDIFCNIKRVIDKEGLDMIHHRSLPPGDGSISLGQCVTSFFAS